MDEFMIARFWKMVDRRSDTECWEWTGDRNVQGYGRMTTKRGGRKQFLSHRLSWQLHNRELVSDECVCHKCDNPPCVNPAHLFVGTRKENLADMRAKGRGSPPPRRDTFGEEHGAAKLTEAQAVAIIRRGFSGEAVKTLAAECRVTTAAVYAVLSGISWGHLQRPAERVRARRVITPELRALVRASPKKGTELSLELGLPRSTICLIRKG